MLCFEAVETGALPLVPPPSNPAPAVFHPSGRSVFTAHGSQVREIDCETGGVISTFHAGGEVLALVTAAPTTGSRVRLIALLGDSFLETLDPVRGCVVSRHAPAKKGASDKGRGVRCLVAGRGAQPNAWHAYHSFKGSKSFHSVCASTGVRGRHWVDLAATGGSVQVHSSLTGAGKCGAVTALAADPVRPLVVAVGTETGHVVIWDCSTSTVRVHIEPSRLCGDGADDTAAGVAASASAATGGGTSNPGSGSGASSVRCLAFTPDGSYLVVGASTGHLTMWSTSPAGDASSLQPAPAGVCSPFGTGGGSGGHGMPTTLRFLSCPPAPLLMCVNRGGSCRMLTAAGGWLRETGLVEPPVPISGGGAGRGAPPHIATRPDLPLFAVAPSAATRWRLALWKPVASALSPGRASALPGPAVADYEPSAAHSFLGLRNSGGGDGVDTVRLSYAPTVLFATPQGVFGLDIASMEASEVRRWPESLPEEHLPRGVGGSMQALVAEGRVAVARVMRSSPDHDTGGGSGPAGGDRAPQLIGAVLAVDTGAGVSPVLVVLPPSPAEPSFYPCTDACALPHGNGIVVVSGGDIRLIQAVAGTGAGSVTLKVSPGLSHDQSPPPSVFASPHRQGRAPCYYLPGSNALVMANNWLATEAATNIAPCLVGAATATGGAAAIPPTRVAHCAGRYRYGSLAGSVQRRSRYGDSTTSSSTSSSSSPSSSSSSPSPSTRGGLLLRLNDGEAVHHVRWTPAGDLCAVVTGTRVCIIAVDAKRGWIDPCPPCVPLSRRGGVPPSPIFVERSVLFIDGGRVRALGETGHVEHLGGVDAAAVNAGLGSLLPCATTLVPAAMLPHGLLAVCAPSHMPRKPSGETAPAGVVIPISPSTAILNSLLCAPGGKRGQATMQDAANDSVENGNGNGNGCSATGASILQSLVTYPPLPVAPGTLDLMAQRGFFTLASLLRNHSLRGTAPSIHVGVGAGGIGSGASAENTACITGGGWRRGGWALPNPIGGGSDNGNANSSMGHHGSVSAAMPRLFAEALARGDHLSAACALLAMGRPDTEALLTAARGGAGSLSGLRQVAEALGKQALGKSAGALAGKVPKTRRSHAEGLNLNGESGAVARLGRAIACARPDAPERTELAKLAVLLGRRRDGCMSRGDVPQRELRVATSFRGTAIARTREENGEEADREIVPSMCKGVSTTATASGGVGVALGATRGASSSFSAAATAAAAGGLNDGQENQEDTAGAGHAPGVRVDAEGYIIRDDDPGQSSTAVFGMDAHDDGFTSSDDDDAPAKLRSLRIKIKPQTEKTEDAFVPVLSLAPPGAGGSLGRARGKTIAIMRPQITLTPPSDAAGDDKSTDGDKPSSENDNAAAGDGASVSSNVKSSSDLLGLPPRSSIARSSSVSGVNTFGGTGARESTGTRNGKTDETASDDPDAPAQAVTSVSADFSPFGNGDVDNDDPFAAAAQGQAAAEANSNDGSSATGADDPFGGGASAAFAESGPFDASPFDTSLFDTSAFGAGSETPSQAGSPEQRNNSINASSNIALDSSAGDDFDPFGTVTQERRGADAVAFAIAVTDADAAQRSQSPNGETPEGDVGKGMETPPQPQVPTVTTTTTTDVGEETNPGDSIAVDPPLPKAKDSTAVPGTTLETLAASPVKPLPVAQPQPTPAEPETPAALMKASLAHLESGRFPPSLNLSLRAMALLGPGAGVRVRWVGAYITGVRLLIRIKSLESSTAQGTGDGDGDPAAKADDGDRDEEDSSDGGDDDDDGSDTSSSSTTGSGTDRRGSHPSHRRPVADPPLLSQMLTSLPLSQRHRLVCVRMALKRNWTVRNYGVCHEMIQYLVPRTRDERKAASLMEQGRRCEEEGNVNMGSVLERPPWMKGGVSLMDPPPHRFCHWSMTPLPKLSARVLECPLCEGVFKRDTAGEHAVVEGSTCPLCEHDKLQPLGGHLE